MAKQTTDADTAIGKRVRAYRLAAGLSQTDLGEMVGVTFQQIQKYEKGINRVSGSRMLGIAEAVGVAPANLLGTGSLEAAEPETFALMASNEGSRLAEAFGAIKKASHRAAVIELARSLAL